MALPLVGEVAAYLATDTEMTAVERLILFAIAEQANAQTREAWQSNKERRWVLREVVGVGEDGLKSALQKLAKRGLEVRVPIGKDKNDKILYAVKGHQTTYRLPALPGVETPPMEPYGGVLTPVAGVSTPPIDLYGGVDTPHGGVSTPPFPSASPQAKSSSSRAPASPEEFVSEATGASAEEAVAIVKRIRNERDGIRSIGAFLHKLARDGDLRRYLTEHRAAKVRDLDAVDRKVRQGKPRCEHGMAGGAELHSITGEIRCRACRSIQQFTLGRPA